MTALTTLLLVVGVLATTGFAQYRQGAIAFEDDQVRVIHVSLLPGASRTIQDHQGGLLVSLTATLEGQIPPIEASWYAAGSTTLENRAKRPFEGVFVALRARASGAPAPLPPEVAGYGSGWSGGFLAYSPYGRHPSPVRTIVDNEQVLVSRHRLPPLWLPTEAPHFHPRDVVLVYLAGGQIDGATGDPGVRHARRGDVDVIPANLLHEFRNVGNDPIEFVMITPK